MPSARNRGCEIYYEVEGSGPLLVLQHGFFGSQMEWQEFGYVEGLRESFTVATVDSLAHGKSDKPTEGARYRLSERAGDIVAVIDALGADKAHLLGYSMGSWISVGVAKHYPERLASLILGGWDCVDGMAKALVGAGFPDGRVSFDDWIALAKQNVPSEALAWIKDAVARSGAALEPCYDELYDLDGSRQAVLDLNVPIVLWDGIDDPYHDPMRAFAASHGFEFLSVPGDHLGAMRNGATLIAPFVTGLLQSDGRMESG